MKQSIETDLGSSDPPTSAAVEPRHAKTTKAEVEQTLAASHWSPLRRVLTWGGSTLFGLAMSFVATRVLGMQFSVSMDILLIAVGFSATIGIGFGFFPARKAARLNPIEALRHE